jgi:hypothetical protein
MKTVLGALLSIAFTAGGAWVADAQSRYDRDGKSYNGNRSPSIAARQRHDRAFDESQYYERLSEKVPFGTAAWWRQKEREGMAPSG